MTDASIRGLRFTQRSRHRPQAQSNKEAPARKPHQEPAELLDLQRREVPWQGAELMSGGERARCGGEKGAQRPHLGRSDEAPQTAATGRACGSASHSQMPESTSVACIAQQARLELKVQA